MIDGLLLYLLSVVSWLMLVGVASMSWSAVRTTELIRMGVAAGTAAAVIVVGTVHAQVHITYH